MARSNLPADRNLAARVIDHDSALTAKKTDHGLLGILGDAQHKPGNVAFIAIVLSFLLILALLFCRIDPTVDKGDLFSLAGTIITGALGFMFGRASSGT